MIDVCNIFNPLNKETGNFLIFSQYTNDLSKSTTVSDYQVRPSKFICLNLDSDTIKDFPTIVEGDANYNIPGYFQNQFENGISEAKTNNIPITGRNFSIGFWTKLIEVTADGDNIGLQNYIQYVGNIDLQSWKDGFAEIILDIVSGSEKTNYIVNPIMQNDSIDDFLVKSGKLEYNTDGYISGWTTDSGIPISGDINIIEEKQNICIGTTSATGVAPYDSNIPFFDNVFNADSIGSEDGKFEFNTIIITYDVVDAAGNNTWSNIPMGVYFTGKVETEGEISKIGNPVTIYSSKEEAYGAGSAWSLRICTRFSPTPHHLLKVEEVAIESGAMDESISALMAANAEVINTLNTFTESLAGPNGLNSVLRSTYSLFKDSKTNVPYIEMINGKQYWFVNGRNIGEVEAIPMEWDED